MKKIWKFVIGGIESKIFNLVLVTFLTVAGVYMSVIWYQSYQLGELVNQTNDKQQESMTKISKQTMNSVMDKSLQRFNLLHSERYDEIFTTLKSHVSLMNQYATTILSDPEAYEMMPVAEPSLSNDGYVIAQLLYAEGVNKNDPAIRRKAGLIGNMATMMETIYDSYYNLNSCLISTPEGITLNVDDRSAEKIGEDGKPVTFPCTERSWYQKAVKTGDICFTDIEKDMFSDRIGIVCCMPVIVDGEVVAVVGADLFLDNLQESISSTVTSGGFAFIINESGHVIMTADTNGAFLVQTADVAEDLRKSRNLQLAKFISGAMAGKTDVSVVRVGNETYYMCGAKMNNTGWTIISCMNKEVIDTPSMLMYYEYQKINKAAEASYAENINSSRLTMVVLLIAIFLVGLANALVLSRRIV
ncbi:MAG: cache domain-containing protein, partial [Solobacterium sp.]|nr:cache domain-containing protein [Solobacterium sp.]